MYLKRLELQGFKSFAHKTVLDFEPGMTAVVGPNGSGKSNVADALRWVMGEQSLKLLRGKKSEDVIFAGSDKKSKLSMAEVGLTFDNKDHKIPVEYTEVVITRRIFRNGESEYLMNNQRVRLLDVVDALMRSGFGATNYAVIGQGTIDQMILAGPAEIKNLVEEAAGVKPYYLKREKTIRRLEQTEENLKRVSDLVAEIEPRLRSLKRQAKRMEEREAVANELAELQLKYYGNQFYLLETEFNALNDNVNLKARTITDLEFAIDQFQKTLEKDEQQNKQQSQFSYELSSRRDGLDARKYKLQEDLAEIRGKIKAGLVPGKIDAQSLNIEKMDLERQLEGLDKKKSSMSVQLKSDEQGYDHLKAKLAELAKQIELARGYKVDSAELKRVFEKFESEFSLTVESLSAENFSEIKQKLRQLIADLSLAKNSFTQQGFANVNELLSAKEGLSAELHNLELRMVEQKTLLQTYVEQIEGTASKLNQIKSLIHDNPQQYKDELFKQEAQLNRELTSVLDELFELEKTLNDATAEEKKKKDFLVVEEKKYRQKMIEISSRKDEQNKVLVEKARVETRLENLRVEATDNLGGRIELIEQHKKPELEADIVSRIERLKRQLELAGGIDETTLAEYRETQERFDYLTHQSEDLSKATVDLRSVIEELDQVIKKQFDDAFEKISGKFVEYFRILFNGGRAQMTLLKAVPGGEEELEEADEEKSAVVIDGVRAKKAAPEIVGIEIKATPPGKKLATIAALSGGERALTSIALLCAMLASYPSPFVVLDEVDAALDEANSIRFAKILSTLAHQTQFITITHNRETMREAHTLYGVTMSDEGISKILSLKLEQAEQVGEIKVKI